jgi:eukaryotic-like serine/threonine-protein kinase
VNNVHAVVHGFDGSDSVDYDDPRLVAAAEEYMAALERGTPPDREQFLLRNGEIAADLAVCLEGLELLHSAARSVPQQIRRPFVGGANESQPLGDFRIVREIGRGGMGVVYEAIQLSLGRRVAIKVLPFAASLDASRLERFRNEAQAAAQLHHNNIVPVYFVGIDRGVHFYAMQLIEGQALSEAIREVRRTSGVPGGVDPTSTEPVPVSSSQVCNGSSLSNRRPDQRSENAETRQRVSTVLSEEHANRRHYFRTVARLMHQAATALEHAHAKGVIHRDIKPGNLLLDKQGTLWVTDFGLAQFQTDAGLTQTGDLLGTLRYMSPEQAGGGRVLLDHRTDIYSLGATMYEVLTLEPVFEGSDRNTLLWQIVDDEPRALRSLDKTIPLELETIVLKATAKAAADRYETAQHFADDLQRWLDDKPILARRPTLAERLRHWGRRHRTVVRAAMIVFLLAVAGLAVSAIVIAREHADTTAAYLSEIKQRAAAEASFRQARQAIDAFTQLGEEELADKPPLHQLRRKFLEKSLEYYNAFLKMRGSDPTVSSELTAATQRVSRIVEELALLDQLAPLMLLYEPSVQDELKIPADQRSQMEALVTQLWNERQKTMSPRQSTQEPPQSSVTDNLRSHGEKIFALLSPEQLSRLKQIAWQQQGALAFTSPDIIAALQLTPGERNEINRIIGQRFPFGPPGPHVGRDETATPGNAAENSVPGATYRDDPGGNSPQRYHSGHDQLPHDPSEHDSGKASQSDRKAIGEHPPQRNEIDPPYGPSHEKRTVETILEVLTPEQRIAWKNLIGAPFTQIWPGRATEHVRAIN